MAPGHVTGFEGLDTDEVVVQYRIARKNYNWGSPLEAIELYGKLERELVERGVNFSFI
jgi:hypothetical protein